MNQKEFWKDWKKVTKLEKEAINSLKKAKKVILENIPKDEIIAIYVYGSFARREMNKKSDVDTRTIVSSNKALAKLESIRKKYNENFKPRIEFSRYSLWELKTGKLSKKGKKDRPNTSRFLKNLESCKLIYGKPLDVKEFKVRSDEKDFVNLIKTFNTLFLPWYKTKKIGFQVLIKQVFWLTQLELKIKGKKPKHSFKDIARLTPKGHIVRETFKLRKTKTKDEKVRERFVKRLKQHIKKLK